MASIVDIWNAALSHIGDVSNVASTDEQSVQAIHCRRHYPLVRDALLEMHAWGFATQRIVLAQLDASWQDQWTYCYAQPSNVVNLLAVIDSTTAGDYSLGLDFYPQEAVGTYIPQPFVAESLADGTEIILTNQEAAVLRCTVLVTDPSKFSPLFTQVLGWLLAAEIAGPIIKGDEGAKAAVRCKGMADYYMGKATSSDSNQRSVKPAQAVSWISGR